jgi:hypothetical protein
MISIGMITGLILAALPVEVTLLSGEQRSGTLLKLTAQELTLEGTSTIPAADLLEIRVVGDRPSAAAVAAESLPVRVQLVDGSLLRLEAFSTTVKEARGRHAALGEVVFPLAAVRSLRFQVGDAKLEPLWTQLVEKGSRQDLVVLQKQEVLDHLDGVIGPIDATSIRFLLDGDDITVKREKAFGVIYARRPSNVKIAAQIHLGDGDRLAVKSIVADDEHWTFDSTAGPSWTVSGPAVAHIDFSLGKVAYLSAMEPRSVKFTPYFEFPAGAIPYGEYRRDRNLDGRPLRLGQKTYARGLAIHSKTELVYRLGGEYRRFQALMGIDDEFTNPQWGAVEVTIRGDRKVLYAGVCRPREHPIPLDLDVTGVVELEIVVDFGPDQDHIGDRLHLAEARVVK